MNKSKSGNRTSIQEILTGLNLQNDLEKSGMSERDVANFLSAIAGIPSGVFYGSMKVGETMGRALNIKSSKRVEKIFPYDYVNVVFSLVLSLRSLDMEIIALHDTYNGSFIEIKLPVDIFSFGGSLLFEVIEEAPSQILVIGISEIRGQMFDWGKGKRNLNRILDKTDQYLQKITIQEIEL